MTAPVPATVETLAVQLVALSRRLDDVLIYRDREEKIRIDELAAWRISHNEILASADKNYALMVPRTEYTERHKGLEQKIESLSSALEMKVETDNKFFQQRLDRMDADRNTIKIDVNTLLARTGYVSGGFILAIMAIVISMVGVWVNVVHPFVALKP